MKINDSGHTFCRLTLHCLVIARTAATKERHGSRPFEESNCELLCKSHNRAKGNA